MATLWLIAKGSSDQLGATQAHPQKGQRQHVPHSAPGACKVSSYFGAQEMTFMQQSLLATMGEKEVVQPQKVASKSSSAVPS